MRETMQSRQHRWGRPRFDWEFWTVAVLAVAAWSLIIWQAWRTW